MATPSTGPCSTWARRGELFEPASGLCGATPGLPFPLMRITAGVARGLAERHERGQRIRLWVVWIEPGQFDGHHNWYARTHDSGTVVTWRTSGEWPA